jgi:uracil-DNA glycosylase family 4
MPHDSLALITSEVVDCTKCPRLVEWRKEVGENPPARFRDESYWARPVPGFGDPFARVLIVGLAPAAHGGNRTGRIFTGDRSGEWLFRALHRAGFANQPESHRIGDGLKMNDCYVAAAVRCAPPQNKPLPSERDNCLPYLEREAAVLKKLKVVVALGAFAWMCALRVLKSTGAVLPRVAPKFGHGVEIGVPPFLLIGSYHPSQQNTFTGTLTEKAFDDIFKRVREVI